MYYLFRKKDCDLLFLDKSINYDEIIKVKNLCKRINPAYKYVILYKKRGVF